MARIQKEDYTGRRFGEIALWRSIELARAEYDGTVYHQISRSYYEPEGEAICADTVVAAGNWVRLHCLYWRLDEQTRSKAALSWGDNIPLQLYIDWQHPTEAQLTDCWLNLHTFERANCAHPDGPAGQPPAKA